jgi:hypothetical protein
VGVLVQERFSPFYNPETGSSDPGPAIFHFQEVEALNPFLFIFLILGACVRVRGCGGPSINRLAGRNVGPIGRLTTEPPRQHNHPYKPAGIAVMESFTISKGWDSPDETRART